jgi:hypothetical protein
VLFEGADTGDAEEVFEFVKKALLVLFCVRDGLRRHWGNPLFTWLYRITFCCPVNRPVYNFEEVVRS